MNMAKKLVLAAGLTLLGGAKGLANGVVEVKRRADDKSKTALVAPGAAVEAVVKVLEAGASRP